MSANHSANVYLDSCLAPLAEYLSLPDLTDLFINRPSEIWIERLSGRPIRIEAPEITSPLLHRLARQVAAINAQGINRGNPLLAGSLPTGERVQVVLPPATRGDVAFAFRKHVVNDLRLDDYKDLSEMAVLPVRTKNTLQFADDLDPLETVRRAVLERRNILVSGGTSSGKTTFLNAMLCEIPPDDRLILIEDTPELRVTHENAVGLIAPRGQLGEAQVTPDDLLIASLRMRPDRIILGEIRGAEAMTFLRAVNTGHPGSMTTIHADSPERAIDQLALLIMQAGMNMTWRDIKRYVTQSVDIIVQLQRSSGRRGIQQIKVIDQSHSEHRF